MKPVNTKSLLAFIFGQMDALQQGKITPNEAIAQAKLASQASNILNYELKRTAMEIALENMGRAVSAQLRDIESIEFDNAKAPAKPLES